MQSDVVHRFIRFMKDWNLNSMSMKIPSKHVDLLIIGGGAAGLAAAIRAWDNGMHSVLVVDREPYLGGILRQCIHTGFGVEYFKRDLTGPEYLERLRLEIIKRDIEVMLNTTVINLDNGTSATLISQEFGILFVNAKAIILSTGSYERTRENLCIAGTRPAGVFSAGQAQQLINLYGYRIGKNVVVQGTGDIGLIMTRRLILEGYNVVGVFERLPFIAGLLRNKVQCLNDFDIKPAFQTQIKEIHGSSRVTGVTVATIIENDGLIEYVPGTEQFVPCDTVVLSAGLIPNRELLKNHQNSPVDSELHSKNKGVFIAGNAVEIHDLADSASSQGEYAAGRACEYIDGALVNLEKEAYQPGRFKSRWSIPARDVNEDGIVCIVCPRGCILKDGDTGCSRGEEFLKQERIEKRRITTTTIWIPLDSLRKRFAVRLKRTNALGVQKELVKEIKRNVYNFNDIITIEVGGGKK